MGQERSGTNPTGHFHQQQVIIPKAESWRVRSQEVGAGCCSTDHQDKLPKFNAEGLSICRFKTSKQGSRERGGPRTLTAYCSQHFRNKQVSTLPVSLPWLY